MLALLASQAAACDVPVYIFARERWTVDPYEVIVFHRGLGETNRAAIAALDDSPAVKAGIATIRLVSLDEPLAPADRAIWDTEKDKAEAKAPWVALFRGGSGQTKIWSGAFTPQVIPMLLDSPLRQKMAQRLADGTAVVWLLIECGNPIVDDQAATFLQGQLEQLKQTMPAPRGDSNNAEGIDVSGLRTDFALIRLSRDNPREKGLLAMLVADDEPCRISPAPVAVAVFGRGHFLPGMIGNEIDEDSISGICQALTGPCFCEIKQRTPGHDLLLVVPAGGRVLTERSGVAPPTQPAPAGEMVSASAPQYNPLWSRFGLAAGAGVVIILAAGTFVLLRRRRSE